MKVQVQRLQKKVGPLPVFVAADVNELPADYAAALEGYQIHSWTGADADMLNDLAMMSMVRGQTSRKTPAGMGYVIAKVL